MVVGSRVRRVRARALGGGGGAAGAARRRRVVVMKDVARGHHARGVGRRASEGGEVARVRLAARVRALDGDGAARGARDGGVRRERGAAVRARDRGRRMMRKPRRGRLDRAGARRGVVHREARERERVLARRTHRDEEPPTCARASAVPIPARRGAKTDQTRAPADGTSRVEHRLRAPERRPPIRGRQVNRLRHLHLQTETVSRVSSDERREAPRRGNVPRSSWKLSARAFTNQIPQSRVWFTLVIGRLSREDAPRSRFVPASSPSPVSPRPPRPLRPPPTAIDHALSLLTRRTRTPA